MSVTAPFRPAAAHAKAGGAFAAPHPLGLPPPLLTDVDLGRPRGRRQADRDARPAHPPHAPAETESLWAFVRPHVRQHRWALLVVILLNAIPGFAAAFQTFVPKYLIDDVLTPAGLSPHSRMLRLGLVIVAYLVAGLGFRMAVWYGSYQVWTRLRERITLEMRARFFRHLNSLCLRFHGRHSSGELFTYVMGAPLGQVSSFYHNLMMNVPNAVTSFLFTLGLIFAWDGSLTLVMLGLVAATVLVTHYGSSKLERLHEDFHRVESKVIGRLTDIFRGNRDVKMYAIEERISAKFEENADVLREKACERDLKTHRVNMRQEAIGYVAFALVLCLAGWRTYAGHLTTGQFFGYLGAYGALQAPMALIFSIGTGRGMARAGLKRLREVLSAASTTPDPRPHIAETVPDRGDLTLRDVRFSYDPENDVAPVIDGVTLTIPFGQRVAFVGPSGSGKSTLAKLLLRLYDPEGGEVRLGGIDLRRCRASEVRQRFGVVPQDPYLFATTVRENLQVTRPNATDDELRHACELANAWEFVSRLPQGLDTPIGESGARLSGGQKQRLAIARALLNDPRYLVFDEATSALDTVSERLVQEALGKVLADGQRTAVFIAHRLSTIKNCDRILVIDDGRVVQDGTFEQLKHAEGLFRRMVESDQF